MDDFEVSDEDLANEDEMLEQVYQQQMAVAQEASLADQGRQDQQRKR